MSLNTEDCLSIARGIITGSPPDLKTLHDICETPDDDVFNLLAGADLIRNFYQGKKINLCTICNAKSGKCSENCGFCPQSAFHQTQIENYGLLGKEELTQIPKRLSGSHVNRYSVVTSGRGLSSDEVDLVAQAFLSLEGKRLSYCASLGIIQDQDFDVLKNAGVTRYHHNLETAESHFKKICTTHTFKDRIDNIKRAQKAGFEICSGGIFGIGETNSQILELALELKRLDIDAVPLNFLSPIPGTPMEGLSKLTPLKCLKIIALFRYVLPEKDIIICGGRQLNLKQLVPFMFHAGANGIMTGNYLTTQGASLEDDIEMIIQLGFEALV
ncbi:biotin synthase BioB [Desulfospira joergensenii]|uniref:biotin synthase BioB n=1 Tax=Desulfospira joergensenii TaxID=53329 RepID=UPI0003B37CFF|nr:biotin synthase BioB [Desulfospira joergensenii]